MDNISFFEKVLVDSKKISDPKERAMAKDAIEGLIRLYLEERAAAKKAEGDGVKEGDTCSIGEAIETPLRKSIRKLTDLIQKLPPHMSAEVNQVLALLSQEDIFQPTFADPTASVVIDGEVSNWLKMEYTPMGDSCPISAKRGELKLCVEAKDVGLHRVDFDIFQYIDSPELLRELHFRMFESFGLLEKFKIAPETLRNFLKRVQELYKDNPFHNYSHAFDATQMVFFLMTEGGMASYLRDIDLLALLLAATGHDLGHPGLNNTYHKLTRSQLAIRYNDHSIQENYHCSLLFSVLEKPGCQILASLSSVEYDDLRKCIISCILGTDLQYHFEILSVFRNRVKKSREFNYNSKDDRLKIMKAALKAADVSNPVRPLAISQKWTERLMEEFYLQGDKEKEQDLPVSPFMDRNKSSVPKVQTAFMDYVVEPLYTTLTKSFPNLQGCLDNLHANRKHWNSLLK